MRGTVATANPNLHPWGTLGTKVEANMTVDEALEKIGADDEVKLRSLWDVDSLVSHTDAEELESHLIPTHQQVWSNRYGHLWVTGEKTTIMQRRDLLNFAMEIAGLGREQNQHQGLNTTAHVETIGNLGGGNAHSTGAERFFAYLRFPDLVIDPNGCMDRIERGLYVATSYDQSWPHIIGYANTRLACMNELAFTLRKGLSQVIKVKHTLNAKRRMEQAAKALGYVGAVEEDMKVRAEKMLRTDGEKAGKAVLDDFWPIRGKAAEELSPAQIQNRREVRDEVMDLYDNSPSCSQRVGENGYGVYQAVTEWLDHRRPVRMGAGWGNEGQRRAVRACFPGETWNMKVRASEVILKVGDS